MTEQTKQHYEQEKEKIKKEYFTKTGYWFGSGTIGVVIGAGMVLADTFFYGAGPPRELSYIGLAIGTASALIGLGGSFGCMIRAASKVRKLEQELESP